MDITKQLAAALDDLQSNYERQLAEIHEELNKMNTDIGELRRSNKSTGITPELSKLIESKYKSSACRVCKNAFWTLESNAGTAGEFPSASKGDGVSFSCLISYPIKRPVASCSQQLID